MTDQFSPPSSDQIDQSQFDSEAWLYDANKPQPVMPDPNRVQLPFWKTKQGKLMLAPLALVVVVIIIAGIVMIVRGRQAAKVAGPSDPTSFATVDLGPLGDKVKTLSTELKAADPTKELDPFPPVRLDLRLDEVQP